MPPRLPGFLAPALAVLAALALLVTLAAVLGRFEPGIEKFRFTPLPGFPERIALEDRYRIVVAALWWLASTYVFWLVALCGALYCAYVICASARRLDPVRRRRTTVAVLLVLLAVVASLAVVAGESTLVSGQDVIRTVRNVAERPRWLMELSNALAIVVIVTVIAAACVVLLPDVDGSSPGEPMRRLNGLLYCGAAVIALWIVNARLLYGFASTLLIEEQRLLVARLAPTIALVAGALAGIFLALMYLAGVLALHARHEARSVVAPSAGGREPQGATLREPSAAARAEGAAPAPEATPLALLRERLPKLVAVALPALPGILESFFSVEAWP